jgi:aminoglycoside 6'-N-acetyltransferase I
MRIKAVEPSDAGEWLRMRNLLWPPGADDDHAADIARFFAGDTLASCPAGGAAAVLVAERGDNRLGGFIEVGVRPFAEGCESRPVGYIEGWFVDEDLRRRGIGRELVRAGESWALTRGCGEMASDCYVDNEASRCAHLALGYVAHERTIHFSKRIGEPSALLRRAAHVNLSIDDVAAARRFYGEVLGLEPAPRPADTGRPGCWFRLGELELHLSLEPDADNAGSRRHVAFEAGDLDRLRERLSSANALIEEARPMAGVRRFFARDPAGNRLEFYTALVPNAPTP